MANIEINDTIRCQTTEEKAKAYDRAVNAFGYILEKTDLITGELKEDVERIFPELAKSADDKIIGALIEGLVDIRCQFGWNDFGGVPISELLSWLEKQGGFYKFCNSIQIGDKVTKNEEGVLVNLSEAKRDDELNTKTAMLDCHTCSEYHKKCYPEINMFSCEYPIKTGDDSKRQPEPANPSIPEKTDDEEEKPVEENKDVKEDKPNTTEDSDLRDDELDSAMFRLLIAHFEHRMTISPYDYDEYAKFLKEFKERCSRQWKPSEEQLGDLLQACNFFNANLMPLGGKLKILLEQLKSL